MLICIMCEMGATAAMVSRICEIHVSRLQVNGRVAYLLAWREKVSRLIRCRRGKTRSHVNVPETPVASFSRCCNMLKRSSVR